MLSNHLSSRSSSILDGGCIGILFIDTPFVRDEVNLPPQNVERFVNPFVVDRGIEALHVVPSRLLVLCLIAKVESNNVAFSKFVLECDEVFYLNFLLGEVESY